MVALQWALSVALLAATVSSKRYCLKDAECSEDVGGLYCIKSQCDRGVCSCPRGQASKYLGSLAKYQCVPVKALGEWCSNDGDTGICGAQNSHCNETTGRCMCNMYDSDGDGKNDDRMVPMWGGERCERRGHRSLSETCSSDAQCLQGNCMSSTSQAPLFWHPAVDFNTPVCACNNMQTMKVMNWFYNPVGNHIVPFVGRKEPTCVPRWLGEQCWENEHCYNYGPSDPNSLECDTVKKQCVCKKTLKPDIWGMSCRKPLGYGAKCGANRDNVPANEQASDYHCDGSEGLVCGDVCAVEGDNTWKFKNVTVDETVCVCGPHHTTSNKKCTERKGGSQCFGDYNCMTRIMNYNGVCVDGTCQDGAVTLMASMTMVLLPVMVSFYLCL